MKTDKNRPVSSFKHDEKRAAIPDSAHQGEEQMAISGQLEESEYDIFRHEFQRGRDPELYWLGKYNNDDEDNPDYMPQMRTDIRSLYKHVDNNQFAHHSWYFRNALVRANYRNVSKGIDYSPVYLERFFRNLLLGKHTAVH